MRFLVAQPGPSFSVADVYAGWVEALRAAGQHVAEFNLNDRLAFYGAVFLQVGESQFRPALTGDQASELAVNGLYAAILKVRPHVLLVVSAFFTPPELLEIARAAGVKVVVVHTESPYEDERQLLIAGHADLNVVNDPANLVAFSELAPAVYFPHAYRPSVHHPGPPVPEIVCDFAFVGTGYPSRVEFLERMDLAGLDVVLAGNWHALDGHPLARHVIHGLDDCLDNTQAADLYRSAAVGMNLYRREAGERDRADGWACGPREVEMAACGMPFVRDSRPESDQLFGSVLPAFSSPEEAGEQIRWLLAHEDARLAAAARAREAIEDRTFDRHAARLLRLLDKE